MRADDVSPQSQSAGGALQWHPAWAAALPDAIIILLHADKREDPARVGDGS